MDDRYHRICLKITVTYKLVYHALLFTYVAAENILFIIYLIWKCELWYSKFYKLLASENIIEYLFRYTFITYIVCVITSTLIFPSTLVLHLYSTFILFYTCYINSLNLHFFCIIEQFKKKSLEGWRRLERERMQRLSLSQDQIEVRRIADRQSYSQASMEHCEAITQ